MAVASTLAFAASATVPGDRALAETEVQLLNAHNLERDRVGVPRLRWNPSLAQEAQAWADTLASSGQFEHSRDREDEGENLWMGTAGSYSTDEMVGGFVEEARYFTPGQFPEVSKTGSWQDVGHYTQLIWPETREVGCAVSRARGHEVLVCRYFPAGNVMGEKIG
ncbi:SCP-like extracellular [Novosphingobium sp. Gsoil 351]|nr:SCP-like extracellular [Novosphingobium sp. Gsoil 351]